MPFSTIYRRNISIFYLTTFFRACIFTIPMWIAYERQFINASQFMMIETIILGSQLMFELPTGAFADLLGKRVSVTIGYLVCGMAQIVYGFSTTYSHFLVYALLLGFGEACISGAGEALMYDTLKQSGREDLFDRIMAKMEIVFQVTIAVASAVGGLMAVWFLRLPIWGYAAATIAAAITGLFFIEPTVDTEKFSFQNYLTQITKGVKELSINTYVRALSWFYIFVGGISWTTQLIFNNMVLVDLKYSSTELGFTLSALRIINGVVLFRLIHIGKLFTKQYSFILFPVLMLLAYLPGIWLTKWVAIPFVMLAMFISTARWTVLGKFTNQEFTSRNRATAISTLSMGVGVLYVLLTLAAGPILTRYGDGRVMYTFLGLLSLISVVPLGWYLTAYVAKQRK